jgi:uncharacterized repeat protein (TIGR03803 family)
MAVTKNRNRIREVRQAMRAFGGLAIFYCLVTIPLLQAQTFTVLHSFQGDASEDGANPVAGLVEDGAGNFYGTTQNGGGFPGTSPGVGTIFELNASGTERVLLSFTNQHLFDDGRYPSASLIRDASGNLYGTTIIGATACGNLFKMAPHGGLSILHNFSGSPDDGCGPTAALVRDCCGNVYGTTPTGGSDTSLCTGGCGTVFRLDKNGDETVLRSFAGWDGAYPNGPLLSAGAGIFYGTTSSLGLRNNYGTVFKIDSTGRETVLYRFTGGADGANPVGSLVLDAAGNLYGTTQYGGDSSCLSGCGVVFKLSSNGEETVLHSLNVADDDVNPNPNSGLIQDAAGNFYGTTSGSVFKLDTTDNFTVLHNFTGGADGAVPNGVLLGTDGNLYGTANGGGQFDLGTIFEITP